VAQTPAQNLKPTEKAQVRGQQAVCPITVPEKFKDRGDLEVKLTGPATVDGKLGLTPEGIFPCSENFEFYLLTRPLLKERERRKYFKSLFSKLKLLKIIILVFFVKLISFQVK
jgi:hypothetical protein